MSPQTKGTTTKSWRQMDPRSEMGEASQQAREWTRQAFTCLRWSAAPQGVFQECQRVTR
jgi:hypothetical protein